jgi:outer membrane protein OmpA-like peptidoglycan-associated protein
MNRTIFIAAAALIGVTPAALFAQGAQQGRAIASSDVRTCVEGHTDSTGSVAMNNELSLRRAMTARDYAIFRSANF